MLTIDFETRSACDIKKGAARYAEDPTTEVMCLALKEHGKSPVLWYPDWVLAEWPELKGLSYLVDKAEVERLIQNADKIEAHNAQFEYFIWRYVMPKYGFAMFDRRALRCSAAKAAAFSLPRALGKACAVLGLSEQKDSEGATLMRKLCKPRAPTKEESFLPGLANTYLWRGSAEEYARLGEYCMQDVISEEALSDALPNLTPYEQGIWQLDLEINDRGIRIDRKTVEAVIEAVGKHTDKLGSEFRELTQLETPKQVAALLEWFERKGHTLDTLRASEVRSALEEVEDPVSKRVLEIRESLALSSTAKYKAFVESSNTDDRVRGSMMYHGAGTGRWTGKIIQPQNFPRGKFSDAEGCIKAFGLNKDIVPVMYGDVMSAASTCLRGMLIPSDGKTFVCADFSAIEGRVLAWLANEQSALDVYREGKDPYKYAAAQMFHVDYAEVTKDQRQRGKVAELACGYQGGVGAFHAMAKNYGLVLPDEEAAEIVRQWREQRPFTRDYWSALELAYRKAVLTGRNYAVFGVVFGVQYGSMRVLLPSGRSLWYANPRIERRENRFGKMVDACVFDGENAISHKWGTLETYGGKLAENITQAVARDLLANALVKVTEAGYEVVMHVHDEILAESAPDADLQRFCDAMCDAPAWAKGLPLKAEGWKGNRYRK